MPRTKQDTHYYANLNNGANCKKSFAVCCIKRNKRPTTFLGKKPRQSTTDARFIFFNPFKRSSPDGILSANGRQVPLVLVRNQRARRYVFRLSSDGSARLTIPRGGSAN